MEDEIAAFMIKAAKFEFYLVNRDLALAHIEVVRGLCLVTGVNWAIVAKYIEAKHPFKDFDFERYGFEMFRNTAPQYLVMKKHDGRLHWDSDNVKIDSWEQLLARGYSQFRNNIAHGNKSQLLAPFTEGRTQEFLSAAHLLIDFITRDVFDTPNWDSGLMFQ
ncbi:hypothetical protein [Aminobacter aminovorans]|uniref:hypothetical protein n=1 Tax=Aminobacter aminovorans TaxID=83263 RepID=UPI00285F0ADE|nr:hypothetical protein [Aminobacter aminovorans]MDR7225253.1 hypothetical protein [Aminobacter aminovorans]